MLRFFVSNMINAAINTIRPRVDTSELENELEVQRTMNEMLQGENVELQKKLFAATRPPEPGIPLSKIVDLMPDPVSWEKLTTGAERTSAGRIFATDDKSLEAASGRAQAEARDIGSWDYVVVSFCAPPPMDVIFVRLDAGDEFVDAVSGKTLATVSGTVYAYFGGVVLVDVKWADDVNVDRKSPKPSMVLKKAPYVGSSSRRDVTLLSVLAGDEKEGRIRHIFADIVREKLESSPGLAMVFASGVKTLPSEVETETYGLSLRHREAIADREAMYGDRGFVASASDMAHDAALATEMGSKS